MVGMMKTTKVVEPVTGGVTDRVLRSGPPLLTESDIIVGDKKNVSNDDNRKLQPFYGMVYSRKRKRIVENGVQLRRKQWMNVKNGCELSVIVKSCAENIGFFSFFLFAALRCVVKFGLKFEDLSAFVLSETICSVYASRGIQFLEGSVAGNVGVCRFFGVKQFMPLFCVDFSAIPLCFKYLHTALLLRCMFRSFFPEYNLVDVPIGIDENIDHLDFETELPIPCELYMGEASESGTISITPEVIGFDDCLSLDTPVDCSRFAGLSELCHNMNFKRIRTRRTPLRVREAQNPLMDTRSNSVLPSYSKRGREKSSAGVAPNKKLKCWANSCTAGILSEANSVMEGSKEALDSSYCSANILIVESDRCYRLEGAIVTLEERPDLRKWHLVVKKDGLTRCNLKADKVMKPCSTNRYTHARMVLLINGWKLEFSKRQDWIAFKNLYKECAKREIPIPAAKFIPVPGVSEISNYADSYTVSFNRPDSYISTNDNEFYRAMTRKTAYYDMDSEDEEWLSKFNNVFAEHISQDDFESTVDALEKAYYYCPVNCNDENFVTYWSKNLVSKKVVKAVHSYWMRKRKQKYSPLLKIFQSYQSETTPFVPKPFMRKKRSFERHPRQISRSNRPIVWPIVWQAIIGEQDALDEDENSTPVITGEQGALDEDENSTPIITGEQDALDEDENPTPVITCEQDALEEDDMLKVLTALAAKAVAEQARERAIQKRKEAQALLNVADVAVYNAKMLVRISETTQAGGSTEDSAQNFRD